MSKKKNISKKMRVGRRGMGSHKHGVSGTPGYSPKLRHNMKLEAEREETTLKSTDCKYKTVADAIRSNKKYNRL